MNMSDISRSHNITSKQSICGYMVIIPYLNNEYTSIATHDFTNMCNCGVGYDYARVQYFLILQKTQKQRFFTLPY